MLSHYLKTALRNIRGNWVYSILSICCLAIGIAMFSVLFYGINYDNFFKNRLPGHKRSYFVYMAAPGNINGGDYSVRYRQQLPYHDYESLLDLPQIEYVSVQGGMSCHLSFSDPVKVYGKGPVNGVYTKGDFFRYWNLSLLYGDRVPRNENEIVVSESLLKRIGYDKDISQCLVRTEKYREGREYQIVNVVRDDKWRRSLGYEVFFCTDDWKVNMSFYDGDVVLKEGASVDEINTSLGVSVVTDDEGRNRILQLTRSNDVPKDRMSKALLSILSILVLLVAVTNYLKQIVMVLKQRNRSNIVRYSLGARQSSLTFMLLAEVLVILILSFAIAQYLTSLVCTWINQTVYMGDRYFHPADLFRLNTLAVVGVVAVSVAVCRIAVYGQKKILKNRIVVYQSERKVLKYIIIGIETSVAVLALASVIDIVFTAPRPYNPLPKSESRRTFYVETEEGDSYTDNQQAFCNKVSQMPQVEEMVSSESDWNGSHAEQFNVQGKAEWLFVKGNDIRYFSFFNIPVEWLDPAHPSSGYLIDRNTYERYMKENVDLSSIESASYNTFEPVRITGVYEEYMFGNPYVKDGDVGGLFRYRPVSEFYTNFFVKFREGVSQSEAEALLRNAWNEVNPSSMEDIRIIPIPKYTDDEYRFASMGFQIGGIVCILLVILSVTSSISAETNIRRKEVALRKINGAKRKDIMGLFIKPYLMLLAVAFPIGILASLALIGKGLDIEGYAKPYVWIAPLALIIVALVIAVSVFSKIRAIMRTNPADVIKSD